MCVWVCVWRLYAVLHTVLHYAVCKQIHKHYTYTHIQRHINIWEHIHTDPPHHIQPPKHTHTHTSKCPYFTWIKATRGENFQEHVEAFHTWLCIYTQGTCMHIHSHTHTCMHNAWTLSVTACKPPRCAGGTPHCTELKPTVTGAQRRADTSMSLFVQWQQPSPLGVHNILTKTWSFGIL